MDADTADALATLAADTEAQYSQAARDRVLAMPRVLTDGLCRIADVVDAMPPAVAEIVTDLGEHLPVFSEFCAGYARGSIGYRVNLAMRVSSRGTRYVTGVFRAPQGSSALFWRCLSGGSCSGAMRRNDDRTFYVCGTCHYQVRVEP